MRVIHPKKKRSLRPLSLEDQKLSCVFGTHYCRNVLDDCRHCGLCCCKNTAGMRILQSDFQDWYGSDDFHITIHPLRVDVHAFLEIMRRRLYAIGEESAKKRKLAQQKYRQRKQQRMNLQFCHLNGSDEDEFLNTNLF